MEKCDNCKFYEQQEGKWVCNNEKSENYGKNTLPFGDCEKYKRKNAHTNDELAYMQSLPLYMKEQLTMSRIRDWVSEYGIDGVYVSFSGGKDSTVLLDLARRCFPTIKAVFVDTGLEYPEIREYVRQYENVDWIKPKMTFRQVIDKYGYPFISKEVAECVEGAKKYLTKILEAQSLNRQTDRQTDRQYSYYYRKLTGTGEYSKFSYSPRVDEQSLVDNSRGGTTTSGESCEELANIPQRMAIMIGKFDEWYFARKGTFPRTNGDRSRFSQVKYKFFLDAPDWLKISNKCCNVMKKEPAHRYSKETGRYPIIATMAEESRLRKQKWIQNGCNGFHLKQPVSNPMSFWTEQDVLLYIKNHNLPIASVYGDIVADIPSDCEGQLSMFETNDCIPCDGNAPKLKTTGCKRTGCMFCGFGCHLEKEGEGRFERMKETHPKQYDYIMRPTEQGGMNYKQVIDWINEHGNLHIRY